MYRIGLFSKFTRITVKALRWYEETGLLAPEWTDPVSGYRYYSSSQLPDAHRIVSLRQCGFTLEEIRLILAGRDTERLLERKKAELEKEARDASARLLSIHHYLESLCADPVMAYTVAVKELPAVLVYSKRITVSSYDDYFTVIPEIGAAVTRANPQLACAEDPPYCFIMYHDGEFRERDIDVEFCEAVTARGVETDGIVFKNIARVPEAACVLHKGPYSSLALAYSAVFKWIEDNHRIPGGCPRESYIDGIWNRGTAEDEWLTEVQVPLAAGRPAG